MEGIPPTIPFHVAKAYGVRPAASTARPIAPATPAPEPTPSTPTQRDVPPAVAKLVATRVPGSIDFTDDQPTPAADALPFYRHPADRNAAATAIDLGRALDTQA